MENLPRNDVQLHVVADALRRRFALILAVAVVLTGSVGAYVLTRSPDYMATAKVLVRPVPGNALSPTISNGQQVTIAMMTEAGLVDSPGVAELVNKKLGSTSSPSQPVTATVPPNTEIVQIQFTAASPSAAQAGAQAYADAFLSYRATQAGSTQSNQLDSLKVQAKAVGDNLKKATDAAASDKAPADASAQVQVYANRLATLQDSIGQLQSPNINSGTVISPAGLPKAPVGINPWLFIAAAALLGLAGGLALAIWRERKDDRVRAGSETSVEGLPILSNLPREKGSGHRLITQRDPDDLLANAYRAARAGVTAAVGQPSVVTVASVSGKASAGEVATNLGLSLASAGYRVTLVDASVGTGDVAQLLDIQAEPGLSDALLDPHSEPPLLFETHGLRVLPAGSDPSAARELHAGTRLATLVSRLREQSDYVLIAAPPASTPEGEAVALVGDGVVLVLADKRTTHQDLAHVVGRADQLNVPLIGALCVPRGRQPARHTTTSRQRAGASAGAAAADRSSTEESADGAALEPAASQGSRDGA